MCCKIWYRNESAQLGPADNRPVGKDWCVWAAGRTAYFSAGHRFDLEESSWQIVSRQGYLTDNCLENKHRKAVTSRKQPAKSVTAENIRAFKKKNENFENVCLSPRVW